MSRTPIPSLLWIDDEVTETDPTARILQHEGYRVALAATAEEGIQQIRRGSHDLIMLDYRLPDADGIQLIPRINDEHRRTPIVMISGYADPQLIVAAMRAGAVDYKVKPVDGDTLAQELRRLLGPPFCQTDLSDEGREAESLEADARAAISSPGRIVDVLLDRRVPLSVLPDWATALRGVLAVHVDPEERIRLVSEALTRAREAPRLRDPRICDVLDQIVRTGTKLSLSEFAACSGLSQSHISHSLSAATGLSAHGWCQAATLLYVFRQMVETDEQVSQIAYQIGYQHASQLNRDFKRFFGLPPLRLRRRLKSP